MDIKENLKVLSEKVIRIKANITTEEATKNALVMPFIQILGYDIFDPLEVIPEFTADISTKNNEKVDYCIQKDNEPIIIIECKHWKQNLDLHNTQLERYFSFTKAKFGLLTNGFLYRFFTDLEENNKMDTNPFFEFDLANLKDQTINELKKFHKSSFDINKIFDHAGELKYFNEIKAQFEMELKEPSTDFVRSFASKIYNGRLTEKIMEQFKELVVKAINQKINDTINERLHTALEKEASKNEIEYIEKSPDKKVIYKDDEKGIITTEEEINGFNIVVDILKDIVADDRIVYRDTKSYLGILLDDNNRKPICRLRFNSENKYIGILNENKDEQKFPLEKIEHIYRFDDEIIEAVKNYLNDENQ